MTRTYFIEDSSRTSWSFACLEWNGRRHTKNEVGPVGSLFSLDLQAPFQRLTVGSRVL